jgi:hypothetical protein
MRVVRHEIAEHVDRLRAVERGDRGDRASADVGPRR